MAIQNNFPNLTPTLLLDFANAGKLDPRVTFSRATTATYFNSLGVLTTANSNVARFDYDPSTLAAQGLLIEEQRTNSFLQNFDISNASWTKVRATTPGTTTTSPSGGTAQKLVEDSSVSTTHFIRQDVAVTSALTYTQSVYVKAAERNQIQLAFDVDAGAFTNSAVIFTLSGGGSGVIVAGSPTYSITLVGNGWYRCTISQSAAATATAVFRIYLASGGTAVYTGDGTSGLFIWGAQLEQGAFATSVIPTTTTALTRNADVASMTGTNFSSWYNAVEGTLFAEGATYSNTTTACAVSIDDTTANNRIQLRRSATGPASGLRMVSSGGSIDVTLTSGTLLGVNKIAAGVIVSNQNAASNGSLFVGIVSITPMPTVTQTQIGSGPASTAWNGTIRSIRYYPVRVTNAQLQALTG